MSAKRMTPVARLFVMLAVVAVIPGVAGATGEAGEHVRQFEKHIDQYERDVRALSNQLDAVVSTYREGGDAVAAMEDWILRWEEVKYHGAVETVTTPMYPPIWVEIAALRQAVASKDALAEARSAADGLRAALNQGLGALKIKAHMVRSGDLQAAEAPAAAGGGDFRATLDRIRGLLDRAVQRYTDGRPEEARSLISKAYLQNFEGLEGELIEKNPQLVVRLEEDFNAALPGLIEKGAPVEEVRAQVQAMKERLARCGEILAKAESDKEDVF